jgi:predicted DNA-binding ribbon-helix-helix protein
MRRQRFLSGEQLGGFQTRRRSIRREGAVTSIRLENAYWDILSDFARAHQMSRNELIWKLCDEMTEIDATARNVASLLRVACLHYLLGTAHDAADLKITHALPLDGASALERPQHA